MLTMIDSDLWRCVACSGTIQDLGADRAVGVAGGRIRSKTELSFSAKE